MLFNVFLFFVFHTVHTLNMIFITPVQEWRKLGTPNREINLKRSET